MTHTITRDDRLTGPDPAPAAPPVAPPPKLRRRPALIVASVALVALGAILAAWAWTSTTSTEEVLAARDTIARGAVITSDDIVRVRINADPALQPLPASAYDDIVGQRAALDIAAGSLLTEAATVAELLPADGMSVVGVALTPAQAPGLTLQSGDRVRVVLTPGKGADAPDWVASLQRCRGRGHPDGRDDRRARGRSAGSPLRGWRAGRSGIHRQRGARPGFRRALMAVVALTSASGSPGVTTTAVGLALTWPRPVLLIEADPTGGSGVLAGYFRGTREYDVGLIELALSPASPADALRDVVRPLNDGTCFVRRWNQVARSGDRPHPSLGAAG